MDAGTTLQVVAPGTYAGRFGSLSVHADGSYRYTLDNGMHEVQALASGEYLTDTFNYAVTDGIASDHAELTVRIVGQNDQPRVAVDQGEIMEDDPAALQLDLLANDSDVDHANRLQVTDPGTRRGGYGSLTVTSDGLASYRLDNGSAAVQALEEEQTVEDRFVVTVGDGRIGVTSEISIRVQGRNDAPETGDDVAAASEDAVVMAQGNVLANDRDIDQGAALSIVAPGTQVGIYGTLTLEPDGSYRYVLDNILPAVQQLGANETVNDTFAYTVSDGIATSNASLIVAVKGSNDAPALTADVADLTEDAATQASGNVLANDSDPDNGTRLAVATPGVHVGAYGVLSLAADGSYRYRLDAAKAQGLAQGQLADDIFAYTATDGIASVDSTLTLHIVGSNDAPVATADSGAISEDAAAPLTGSVLSNDSDADSGTVLQVGDPGERAGGYGMLNLAANGQYRYTLSDGNVVQSLAAGEVAHDVFRYTATDDAASTGAALDITVVGQNDAPVAIRQIGAQSAQSGQVFSYQLAADAFTDVDHGDTLAYTARLTDGSALPDWLNFDAATHTFSGTPAAGNAGNLGIRLTATDRAGAQTSQSFAITVSGTTVDQAPVTAFDASAASEDNVLVASGNVLANDSDPEGKPMSVVNAGTRSGQWGSLSMGSDGSYHYALNNAATAVQSLAAGQTVFEHFAYQASDGVNSTAGGLTIAVIGRNDVPLLGKPLADKTIAPGRDVSWKMPTGSFADADQGDTLAYSARLANGDALPGWLKFDSATQTFSGRAPRKMKGTLDITVTASDGHGAQSSASDTFCITFDKKGLKGNEGAGNGEDPPPPGHDRNANDGPGASPGDPGSKGLHQDHEQGDRHERQRCHGDDCIKAEAEAEDDDHRNRELACLDLNKVGACGREKDQEQHDSQRSYESNDFYKRWAEMDRALGQWLADDQRGDWLAPGHGADLSRLKGIGLAGGNVELGAGGYDNLSLNTSGALLKGFKGLEEGMHRL